MKRILSLALFFLFLASCSAPDGVSADRYKTLFFQNEDLFRAAAKELENLHRDRFTVILEAEETKETETATAATGADPTKTAEEKLVWYVKKSDKHQVLKAPSAERLLREFPFSLIYYQTASDGRRTVIFSSAPEKEKKVQGVYFSFDGEPAGWWGRKADLKKNKERWVQMQSDGAYYFTLSLQNGFYYFEKHGDLVA